MQVVGVAEPADAEPETGSAADSLASDEVRLTQAGHILGTPAYISPEQILGKEADLRSDIYSLGAVAYYLLTGQPPFRRATTSEMYRAHVSEPPRAPSERQAGIPQDLERIVLRCLSKELLDRYADTRQLELALTHCACAQDWDAAKAAAWWQSEARLTELSEAEASSESGDDDHLGTIGTTSSEDAGAP